MGSSWSAAAADRVRHSPAVAFDSHEGTLIHSGVSECSTRLLGPGNAMPCFRQQTILPIRDYPPKSESLNRDRGDGGCGGGLDLPAPQEPLHNIPTFRIVEHRAHLPPAILCIAIFAPAHIPASVNDVHNGNTHHRSGRNDRAPPPLLPLLMEPQQLSCTPGACAHQSCPRTALTVSKVPQPEPAPPIITSPGGMPELQAPVMPSPGSHTENTVAGIPPALQHAPQRSPPSI